VLTAAPVSVWPRRALAAQGAGDPLSVWPLEDLEVQGAMPVRGHHPGEEHP
jgi:hypothetical protein